MKTSSLKAALAFGIVPFLVTGCVIENPDIPAQNTVGTALVTDAAEKVTSETTSEITVTTVPYETFTAAETTVPAIEYTESEAPPEPELSDDSFKIKTRSTDLTEIAKEVLTHVYSKSEKEKSFEISDIRYMAKGKVEERLWFAVSFLVQTEKDSFRLEALIQQDREDEYSLITINTKVPIDNLTDDDNCPLPTDADFAELLSEFQGANILSDNWNFSSEALPSANNLVIFAEKNLGEKAIYTLEEISAEIQKFMQIPDDYLKGSDFYNQTSGCFSLIGSPDKWRYAFVSSESDGTVHQLKIMGIRGDDSRFSKEILLTIAGGSEQYSLISCRTAERELPRYEVPCVLSHNEILLGENVVSLDLIMTDGQHIESVSEKNIFRQGYRGKYELVLYDGETEICRQPVSFPELELLNFKEPFELAFSDYDKDGDFEFSLGQWQNGKMYYQFYSIDEAGNIAFLPINGEPILTSNAEYSKAFERTENGFSADVYSAELGDFRKADYIVSPENITSVTE